MPNPLFGSLVNNYHQCEAHHAAATGVTRRTPNMRAIIAATQHAAARCLHALRIRPFLVGALLVAAASPLLYQAVVNAATPKDAALAASQSTQVDWPARLRDQPLTQVPPTALERLMATDFPGAVARFTDGRAIVVLREVNAPTRRMLPTAHSLKTLHYKVGEAQLSSDEAGVTWSCYAARAGADKLHVCERFYDSQSHSWTDAAAWFWATQYGSGPWWAVTVIEPEPHAG